MNVSTGVSSCPCIGEGSPSSVQSDAGMATISSDLSRRGFVLLQTLKGAVGFTLLVIFYPVVWFLRPRKVTTSGAMEVVAPFRVNQLATTTSNPFDYGGKPCLVVMTPEGAHALPRGSRCNLTM